MEEFGEIAVYGKGRAAGGCGTVGTLAICKGRSRSRDRPETALQVQFLRQLK